MAHREFEDGSGVSWQVWEVLPGTQVSARFPALTRVEASYTEGWLAFQSHGERRRLAPIPGNWAESPESILQELLNAAAPVRERRRLKE